MSHIFISYQQDDADFAAVLMMELEKAGFDTWLDKQRLRVGSDWSEEIDQGIRTAAALVLVLSPASRASEYVTYEWSCAIGAGIRVVPLLRRETEIHPRLRRLQYLDFRGSVRPWSDLFGELQSIKLASQTYWRPPRDTPPHIQRAISDLDSGNNADRRGAIKAIAESDHHVVGPALHHALSSPFRDVRASAAYSLAERDHPAAKTEAGLEALVDCIRYWGPMVNIVEVSKVLKKTGRVGFDYLATKAKSGVDKSLRLSIIALLGSIGGTDAIPILLELTENPDPDIINAAMVELERLNASGKRGS
jgi:TIR domain